MVETLDTVLSAKYDHGLGKRTIIYFANEREKREEGRLVWGRIYKREIVTRLGDLVAMAQGEFVYHGNKTGELYLVHPDEQTFMHQFPADFDFFGVREMRQDLFHSKGDYIRFFTLLSDYANEGRISLETYSSMLAKVRKLRDRISPESERQAGSMFYLRNGSAIRRVIERLRDELYNDTELKPLIVG